MWDRRLQSVNAADSELSVDASDATSGVAAVDVKIDGGALRPESRIDGSRRYFSFADVGEGLHRADVTVRDAAGKSDPGPATVASAGDVDGDAAPDALIGFPEASSGSGDQYVVLGKFDSDPIDLASMPGHRGFRLKGQPGDAAGRSGDSFDSGADEEPGTVAGAPSSSRMGSQSGSVYATSSAVAAARAKTFRGCQVHRQWAYPYRNATSPPVLPRCRRTARGTVDAPAFSPRGGRGKFNPRPKCGAPSRVCRPTALNGGNARITKRGLATSARVPLKDSFGTVTAYIQQVDRKDPTTGRTIDRLCYEVFSDAAVSKGVTCTNPSQGSRSLPAEIEFVGKACMATSGLEGDHWLIRLLDAPNSNGMRFRELQGFIPRSAITLSSSQVTRGQRAYAGCGQRPSRRLADVSEPLPADATKLFTGADKYLSNGSESCAGTNPSPPCAGTLQNYQSPEFDPRWAVMVISSTAVSGVGYRRERDSAGRLVEVRGGGLVRAIVPRSPNSSFRRYDRMTYSDPNVPCTRPLNARWSYGAANPAGDRDHRIFGWTVRREPAGTRAC